MNILVTGGAGYIGSHATRELLDSKHRVVVADNLSHGFRQAVDPRAQFVQIEIGNRAAMTALMKEHKIEAVVHFAAYIQVGESVAEPLKYYGNNFSAAMELLAAVVDAGVKRFVFSSTAAVYGTPERVPLDEGDRLLPINPYGRSKMMVELALADAAQAYGLGYCILRYFNVAGAHPKGDIGEAHEPESHLIPRILKAALNEGAKASIFGTDYPTPDGTCVRDYVHVVDLATAHVLAVEAVQMGKGLFYNVGSENGFSVREVIKACENVTGQTIPIEIQGRRAGDPPTLVASSAKITRELKWQPRYGALEQMIEHAYNWHRTHPHGYKSGPQA